MSLSSRLAEARTSNQCKACLVIASLPVEDRELVLSELAKPARDRVSLSKLAEILTTEGYPLHRQTLSAHVRMGHGTV